MTPDREQIRRDAQAVIAGNGSSVNVIYLAEKCLALLSKLEQAERERDE